jgi:membrane-bound lytic murein transglycosylase MltF
MRILTIVPTLLLLIAAAPLAQQAPSEIALAEANRKFTGDLDEMLTRRLIRVGVAYNRTHYFIDKGVQRGLAYEAFKLLEDELNAPIKQPKDKIHIVMVPMSRDEMAKALLDGRVDLLAANLTITPERRKMADFSIPVRSDVSEIVVTGPGAPPIATKADLAGQEVFVREGSTYHQHLLELNQRLKAQGLAEVKIEPAPTTLEDDDILEMVNAGLAKITVVDNFLADFWIQVFTNLKAHPNVALTLNGEIAVAMRPNSPQLKARLDAFVKKHGMRTAFGNMILKRYLSSTKFARSATSSADMARLQKIVELFRKYGEQYKMDFLLMAAQGYQESGLNQSVKSPVGAIGVMQVMPATGKDMKVGDITELEANIHAGVKYIRFVIDEFYKDEPMDDLNKGLFAFASYNAGPGRLRQLRAEAAKRGLNPNLWFNNVEQIASERIGRETVTYVSNIFKYYVAYKLALDQMEERRKAKSE